VALITASFLAKALNEASIDAGFSQAKYLDYVEHDAFETIVINVGVPYAQINVSGFQVTITLISKGHMSARLMLKTKKGFEEILGKEYTVVLK